MRGRAEFSKCGKYRFLLERTIDVSLQRKLLIVGLNPSTADATINDPTIRRCINFATTWGYGTLWIANLFAFRSPYPEDLKRTKYPIGLENDEWIKRLVKEADQTIVAWGNGGKYLDRDVTVLGFIKDPHCLGMTKNLLPRHPLYVTKTTFPQPYTRANRIPTAR